ncbi:unnamed protein product [Sphagnum balticum]
MASTVDFRYLDEGFGGQKKKRKREEEEEEDVEGGVGEAMDIQHSNKRPAVAKGGEGKLVYGRPTFDGVMSRKVSGRKWKATTTSRTSALKVVGRKTTLEEKNRLREVKRAYKDRMSELKEQIRSNKVEKRRKVEERKRIKKENELKSTPVQKITNPKTLKKMSKKQRNMLRRVSD